MDDETQVGTGGRWTMDFKVAGRGGADRPTMFHDGVDFDGEPGNDCVAFDQENRSILSRRERPLIASSGKQVSRDVALAKALIDHGETIDLCFSFIDRGCQRPVTRREDIIG